MADPQDNSQGFPGIDPQKVAMVRALVQASQGNSSGIPPAPPSQLPQMNIPSPLGATSPFDITTNLQRLGQIPEVAQPISQMQEAYKGLKDVDVMQQRMQVPESQGGLMPKMGWLDTQGQPQKPGFLHGLERALTALAAATRPGQAIEEAVYGPRISRYQALRDTLSKRRETLEQEAGIPKAQLAAESGLAGAIATGAYKGGELANAQERNRIAQQKADTYQQSVQNKLAVELKNLDIRGLMAGSTVALNNTKMALNRMLTELGPQKLDLEQYGIDSNNATRQAVSNAMAQLGMDRTHPVAQMIDSLLGTSLTPAAPQAPGGAQPVQGATPLPQRTPAKTPAKPARPTKNVIVVSPEDMKEPK